MLRSLLLLALLTVSPLAGQATGIVSGVVTDESASPIRLAVVSLERAEEVLRRAETDSAGAFRFLGVAEGEYTVRTTRIGFGESETEVEVVSGGATRVEVVLSADAISLPGVAVEVDRERVRFDEVVGATTRELTATDLKSIPGVFEADPLRAVEVLPGVITTSDFSAAFHVRGGSSDQNLILLDGIPIFSPFHLGGFVGVFNADVVERAELTSGGFPAEFGGRVSSVLTVDTDPGDGRTHVDAGISLLSSRVALGGGFRDAVGLESARWKVSGRRSYFDILFRPVFDFPYHLTDLQGTFEGFTERGDRLKVTAYTGGDVLDLSRQSDGDFPLLIDWDWGNDVVGATWTRLRRGGGAFSVSTGFSRFGSGLAFPDFADTEFRTEISQGLLGLDLDMVVANRLQFAVGGDLERFSYDNLAQSGGTVFNQGDGRGTLTAAYAQAVWRPSSWLIEAGARLDGWHADPGATVWVPSPRFAVKRFFGGRRWAVKGSVGRFTQFLHSLRDEELPIGLDIWVLTGEQVPHVESDQIQLGVEAFLGEAEEWQVAFETYYRDFDGVVTLNTGEDPNDEFDDLLAGDGTSYGADLLVRRNSGRVNGWLALSWLKAERTFEDQLSPFDPKPEITYPPIFDRRVDADLVMRFPFFKGWDGSLRWNVGTGTPFTQPQASFGSFRLDFARFGGRFVWSGGPGETDPFDGLSVSLGDRNGSRLPVYHRLDFTLQKTFEKSWGTIAPRIDILNVYDRRNVLFYFFEFDKQVPTRSGISMFPILPTFGVEIHF